MDHPPTPTPTAPAPGEGLPTPTPVLVAAPAPTVSPAAGAPLVSSPLPGVQEVATIEDYSASRFYPDRLVVIKDVPLKLNMTRLHREHVNMFTIAPFVTSRDFFAPGTAGLVEFTPDQSGDFKMHNVGHRYEGDFIVVDSVEDARRRMAEVGVQEFSLIHDLEGGRIIPSRIIVQKDLRVRIYNTSLKGDERVSIEPFYIPQSDNIEHRKITSFEFMPDAAGEFVIRYDSHTVEGILVVQ